MLHYVVYVCISVCLSVSLFLWMWSTHVWWINVTYIHHILSIYSQHSDCALYKSTILFEYLLSGKFVYVTSYTDTTTITAHIFHKILVKLYFLYFKSYRLYEKATSRFIWHSIDMSTLGKGSCWCFNFWDSFTVALDIRRHLYMTKIVVQ